MEHYTVESTESGYSLSTIIIIGAGLLVISVWLLNNIESIWLLNFPSQLAFSIFLYNMPSQFGTATCSLQEPNDSVALSRVKIDGPAHPKTGAT